MLGLKHLFVASALAVVSPAVHAGTTIVNLNASSTNPNAGKNSSGYSYNPVNLSLAAGTYTVRVVGIAGGGLYDAFSVYAPTAANAAWTDGKWSVSLDGGVSASYAQADIGGTVADYDGAFKSGRYNTTSAALAAYAAAAPYTFTLSAPQSVAFYVDDSFGDDSGGISLAVASVPEPASIALLLAGLLGAGFVVNRRAGTSRPA